MTRVISLFVALCFCATLALADWCDVAEGVAYRRFNEDSMDLHVARIEVGNPGLRIVATRESERGLTVGEYGRKNKAIVAINADYFDKELRPVGLAIGPCGVWEGTKDTEREGVVAAGDGRVEIYAQKEKLDTPDPWITAAVSGWPLLVRECEALTATQLPGSDPFTRAPHPRTAVGLSKDGKTMYFVVADGRRDGVPGLTLARLAEFMADELGACTAMNLDGGGSTAMWVENGIVNTPSDGQERKVADHLAVVAADDYEGCDPGPK